MATSFKNLAGQTFESLSVLSISHKDSRGAYWWNCRCICGKIYPILGDCLRNGRTKSCGCVGRQKQKKAVTAHGMHGTPEYMVWIAMKGRCINPKNENWKSYGGRGITVCGRWLKSFADFLADMGKRPSSLHSIDRKNNDGNYEPSNCRWATKSEQRLNQRPQKIARTALGQFSKGSRLLGES